MTLYNAYGCPVYFNQNDYDEEQYLHDKHIQRNPMIRRTINQENYDREYIPKRCANG